ncbi:hypothetical protein [Streptomyces spinosisporus]|uniref:Uncharacterized protein n=1 Tax=Streptomyces spinosisporus TaxID=2927582 RepID=A0ABS9XE44_9ACTN|nr:hypothetical protein [Streptomyces spinosisporus]MCI3240273.1 hypothetical protein [Streptomyces spinosisporus]
MLAGLFFAACAALALAGLWLIVPRDVPKISGTCALILTFAALAVAILH